MTNEDLRSLLPRFALTRRGFVVTTLAAGFALSAQPVSADMTDKLSIDPKTTALLVMDFQTFIVKGFATDSKGLLGSDGRLDRGRPSGGSDGHLRRRRLPAWLSRDQPAEQVVQRFEGVWPIFRRSRGTEIHPAVAPGAGR